MGTQPQFSAHVYCGQTDGWMKTPLGMEVVLGPGHCVRRGPSSPPRKGHSSFPLFSAHVYCGHGRPSQLLLSSFRCLFCVVVHFCWLVSVCFCCVRFCFSISSQEIGLGERLWNDLFCVEWNVKPQLNQSTTCESFSVCLKRWQPLTRLSHIPKTTRQCNQ